jgi:hypothetical protein
MGQISCLVAIQPFDMIIAHNQLYRNPYNTEKNSTVGQMQKQTQSVNQFDNNVIKLMNDIVEMKIISETPISDKSKIKLLVDRFQQVKYLFFHLSKLNYEIRQNMKNLATQIHHHNNEYDDGSIYPCDGFSAFETRKKYFNHYFSDSNKYADDITIVQMANDIKSKLNEYHTVYNFCRQICSKRLIRYLCNYSYKYSHFYKNHF